MLAATRSGQVILVDDLGDTIAANKTVLAILSEELDDGALPRRVCDVLRGFIPWTRIVKNGPSTVNGQVVDLLEWSASHKDDLVLVGLASRSERR